MSDGDELAERARELLDAEQAHLLAPTPENAQRLDQARRRLEEALAARAQS